MNVIGTIMNFFSCWKTTFIQIITKKSYRIARCGKCGQPVGWRQFLCENCGTAIDWKKVKK